jgi:hypothetical protein
MRSAVSPRVVIAGLALAGIGACFLPEYSVGPTGSGGGTASSTGSHGGDTATSSTASQGGSGGATSSSSTGMGGATSSTSTGTGGSTSSSTGTGGCMLMSIMPCYDGPPGTLGTGVCKGGIATCEANGVYGPCQMETLPSFDDCKTPADEDCDGKAPACSGSAVWSKGFGDSQLQQGNAVAASGPGEVVFTGSFQGMVDFGGGPLSAGASDDVFAVKLDPAGAFVWGKRFGDPASSQIGAGVAIDGGGNVLLTGGFAGAIDFGGGPLSSAGSSDVFVAKLDASGKHVWSKGFGDASYQNGAAIATDADGAAILVGTFVGSFDLGGPMLASAGSTDAFLAKLDASGGHVFSKRFGDTAGQSAEGVAVDGSKNVIITGYTFGSVDFGAGTQPNQGPGSDVFVAKFGPSGSLAWGKLFGDGADQLGYGVAAGPAGDVVVTGGFLGTIDFGNNPLSSSGGKDLFVARLDPSGSHVWSKRFGDGADQTGLAVAVDGAGNAVVTGSFSGTLDFGGAFQITSAGGQDLFAVKLDPSGNVLWAHGYGDVADQHGRGVAIDGSGNAILSGDFSGKITFAPTLLTSAGQADIFIAKLAP